MYLNVFLSADEKCGHHAVLFWLEARSQLLIFAFFSPQRFPLHGSEQGAPYVESDLRWQSVFLNLEL